MNDMRSMSVNDVLSDELRAELRVRAERIADIVVHGIGIAAAGGGAAYLIIATALDGSASMITGVSIYSACLMTALVCSLLYNATHPSPRKDLLRRFDHAAIFLLIAGTYTPFMLADVTRPELTWSLAAVWTLALAGAGLKLAAPHRFGKLSVVLYIALGWSGIVMFGPLQETLGLTVLIVIGAGGLIYTVGVVFHLWHALPYQRAVWHGFVVAAAATHFSAVTLAAAGAGG